MIKQSSSILRDLLNTTLKALIVLLLLRGCATATLSNIDLRTTTLDPRSTGFIMTGNGVDACVGASVKTAGDVDNDGYDDIIVSAARESRGKGAAYVIYGGPTFSMSNLELSSTTVDPARTGFRIAANDTGDYLGDSVSTAGDINHDGYDDIIVGADGKGVAYVIYGGPKSSMSNIDLSTTTLDPAKTGFIITGNASNSFGESVSTAGDINHDGYADIIIGAQVKKDVQGAVYVIYGGPTSSMSNIDLSKTTLDPAKTGFMVTGNTAGDSFGFSVSTAGDINNDGYDDIIIGSHLKNNSQGAAYVIYGGPKSSMSNIDLSVAVLNPLRTGFMITGNAANDWFGYSVDTSGDINNDGYSDIIVGAYSKNSQKGAAYVIYGGSTSSRSNIDLSTTDLNPATTGFMISGNAYSDKLGFSVSTAGDVNHDGYKDIIVGAFMKNVYEGTTYVIYGGPKSSMSNIDLSSATLDPAKTGFTIIGSAHYDMLGTSVSTAGDINRDGYDDIIVGAQGKDIVSGAAYVIYGGPKPSMANIVF